MIQSKQFSYTDVENQKLKLPTSNFENFKKVCAECIDDFTRGNAVIDKINSGTLTIQDYHHLLKQIFHQVYIAGSTTLALAGAMVDPHLFKIREFLFHHAEEEQNHWKWIIQDLRNTGYTGPDPREEHPSFATEAYRSFAMHFATKYPLESIAICYVLEGLSSKLGVEYGTKAATQLQLTKEQFSFFIQHGELDQGHEEDILEILRHAPLTPYKWSIAEHAAKCTVHFYKEMYNA